MVTWDELLEMLKELSTGLGRNITPESRLIEELGFNSLAVMELLSEIEERFGVDFTDLDNFGNRFNVCWSLLEGINELLQGGRDGEAIAVSDN